MGVVLSLGGHRPCDCCRRVMLFFFVRYSGVAGITICFGVSSFFYLVCCSPDQRWRRISLVFACDRFCSARAAMY